MKKYNLSKIMKRAWEIKREDSRNLFSICLKMAWEEAKRPEKKKFNGFAIIESESNYGTEYHFKAWAKRGMKRIYVSYRGRKDAGFIDCNNNNRCVSSCGAYIEAMKEFLEMYEIA